MPNHPSDPSSSAYAVRLWESLDQPDPWLVLTDWLTERRDPRAVLMRHALMPGALSSAGEHWSRLRDAHRRNGFDGVGGLPWQLSFLVAARELLRVPSRSNFAALSELVEGLTPPQWEEVRPRLVAALERWPDDERFGGALTRIARRTGAPPRSWPLVRAASALLGQWSAGLGDEAWVGSLTQLDVGDVDTGDDLRRLADVPRLRSLRLFDCGLRGADFAGPAQVAALSLVHCPEVFATLPAWVDAWPRLRHLTMVGSNHHPGLVFTSEAFGARLGRRLHSLVLVRFDLAPSREPRWDLLRALRRLALLGCRLPTARGLVRTLVDPGALPRLHTLDLRGLQTMEFLGSALEPLPRSAGFERLEAVGLPFGATVAGFLGRREPLPHLRRLALSGGVPGDLRDAWLSSDGTLAPNLASLDLDLDATDGSARAWAAALDRWPRIRRLALPVRMVESPELVEHWMASRVFRGLDQLVLRGRWSTRALRGALARAGCFPRITRDVGDRLRSDEPLVRDGFVVDVARTLYPGPLERTWAPLGGS